MSRSDKQRIPLAPMQGRYAWSVTVGTKGQIVIPKEARDLFGIRPGDSLMLLADVERGIAIPPKDTFDALLSAVFRGEPIPDSPTGLPPMPDKFPSAPAGLPPMPDSLPPAPDVFSSSTDTDRKED